MNGASKARVTRSKFASLIDECLRSRWAATRVHQYLCQTYGPGWPHSFSQDELWSEYQIPSVQSIERYARATIPETDIISPSMLEERLKGLDVKIDTVKAYAILVPALEKRIGAALQTEESMAGMLLEPVDKAVETYLSTLDRLTKHMFELGLLKRSAPGMAIALEHSGEIKSGDGDLPDLADLTNDQAEQLLAIEMQRAEFFRSLRKQRPDAGGAGAPMPREPEKADAAPGAQQSA